MKNDNLPRMWAKANPKKTNRTSSFDRINVVRMMSHTISADARFQLVLLLHRFSRPFFCLFFYHECLDQIAVRLRISSVEIIKSHWKSVQNQFHRKCRNVQSIDIHGYASSTQLLPIQQPIARSRLTFQVAPRLFQQFCFPISFIHLFDSVHFLTTFFPPVFDLHRINVMMKNDCLKQVEFLVWLQFSVHSFASSTFRRQIIPFFRWTVSFSEWNLRVRLIVIDELMTRSQN